MRPASLSEPETVSSLPVSVILSPLLFSPKCLAVDGHQLFPTSARSYSANFIKIVNSATASGTFSRAVTILSLTVSPSVSPGGFSKLLVSVLVLVVALLLVDGKYRKRIMEDMSNS